MREVLRTNEPVRISFIRALLADSGIETVLLDQHASVMDGSNVFVQRRVMVADEDYEHARRLIAEAGEDPGR
jgi:hypothetical protein